MMTIRKPSLRVGTALLGVVLFAGHVPALHAQFASPAPATAAPDMFDNNLGASEAGGTNYTVQATQPLDSRLKGQKVRFTWKTAVAGTTTTHYFTINTGKYKTVAQLTAYLRDIFAKFLAGAPANSEIGKVGDIKYGGEIRFVAESPDVLRCDSMAQGEPTSPTSLARADVQAFSTILGAPTKQ